MTYDNTNKGVLFPNKNKKSEKQPDYTGYINIDGVDKQLAAWSRQSKNGKPFKSLIVSEPYEKDKNNNGGSKKNFQMNDNKEKGDGLPF